MALDPRRILDDAAQERVACELMPRRGGLLRASLLRVEKGGVVLSVPERGLGPGDDLRVWFALGNRSYSFEASVVRVGVPVPARGGDGVLLGFIDAFAEGRPPSGGGAGGRTFALLPPSGRGISLLDGGATVLHLGVEGATFTLPADVKVVFVESGRVTVQLGMPGMAPAQASAQVRALSRGDGYLLYDLHFVEVEETERWREVVGALARSL
jgi:hypothetical protein